MTKALWAIVCLVAVPLRAHDIFSSWTDVHIREDRIDLVLTLGRSSAALLLADARARPPITPETFPGYESQLKALTPELFSVFAAGAPITVASSDVKLSGEDDVAFHLTYPRPESGPLRFFAAYLGYMVDNHVGTLVVMNAAGKDLGWSPLSVDQPTFDVPLPDRPGATAEEKPAANAPGFGTFLRLGIKHILQGYDHLLFLLGLLVACRRFATMVGIITCFTIAHSITLGLAAFDVVSLSPRIVEPFIAATIIFVGVENLIHRGKEPPHRWVLTFVFGLVHGFGFAGVLKEVGHGLSGKALAVPLFSFNLGVEVGQIAVAAVVLPVFLLLSRRETFARLGPPVVSSLVAAAGAFWFVQRTLFS